MNSPCILKSVYSGHLGQQLTLLTRYEALEDFRLYAAVEILPVVGPDKR